MQRRRAREKQLRTLSLLTPPSMVEQATARRAAGNWRGACAAAQVDVHVDLHDVARRYGAEQAARLEADLTGLAPDLLRRFLPRTDGLALAPGQRVVLSRRPGPMPIRPGVAPVLLVALPADFSAPQRVALRVVDAVDVTDVWYDLPDWTWHAEALAARRVAYGASPGRLPWHHPDGRPYRPGESTPPEQRIGRAAQLEEIVALLDAGDPVGAYERAGCRVDRTARRAWVGTDDLVLWEIVRHAAALPVLVAETRRLLDRYGRRTLRAANHGPAIDVARDGTLTVRASPWEERITGPVAFGVPAPMDAALLRWGALTADELHPLVHEALLPGRSQRWRPCASDPRPPFRVRCGGGWHLVRASGGRLLTPHHSDAEIQRELLFAGLGGGIAGCAAAVRAWRTGAKPVPREIRRIRRELFARAFHGDTDGVLALLADGLDPGLRDATGGTLLHSLSHLDHVRALPALLTAGLSTEDRDRAGATPLHRAAAVGATAVMAALVAAGADPAAVDGRGRSAAQLAGRAVG